MINMSSISEELNNRLLAEFSLPLLEDDVVRLADQLMDMGIDPQAVADSTTAQITEAITKIAPVWVNLTPHQIVITPDGSNERLEFPPSGLVADVSKTYTEFNEYHIRTQQIGRPTGLPRRFPGIYYIVSNIVMQSVQDRDDIVSPITRGATVKRVKGKIVGCPGFWH